MKTNTQLWRCFYTVQEPEFRKVAGHHLQILKNVTMIKEMAVHGWDEVYGYKLMIKINQGISWRCEGYKIRKVQLLAGRHNSDLSKITVPWPV
jgi:hypothetical protein